MSGLIDDEDDIWAVLGVEPTRDRDVIRRAYARKLRVTNPEDDAEAFMRLREAHDEAIQRAQWDWMWDDDDSEEEDGSDGDEAADAAVASPEFVKLVIEAGALTTLLEGRPAAPAAPPPLPDAPTHEAEELRARFERLEALLGGEERPAAAELTAAFHAVLNAEALDEIAIADAVEARVADLLLRAAPRSDPLLAPAIDAFRWRRTDLRFEPGPTVQAVIERCDFVESRDRMLQFDAYARRVIELLKGPPTAKPALLWRVDPGFDRAMKDMLGRIGADNGALMADFDAATVALWRERYARPRLSPGMAAAVASAALLGPIAGAFLDKGWPGVIGCALGAPALVLGGLLAYLFGYLRLKAAWTAHRSWRAGAWERMGWSPASLLLIAAAALLPGGEVSAALLALPCAAVLLWTFVTTDEIEGVANALHYRLLAQAIPVAWCLSLTIFAPTALTPAMLLALATAVTVDFRGGVVTTQAWHLEMREVPRISTVLVMLAATIAAIVAAWNLSAEPQDWAPLCVAIVMILAVGHRPAVAAIGENPLKMRYYVMFALFWAGRVIDIGDGAWLATSAVWMLGGVAVGLGMALYAEGQRQSAT